MPIFASMKQLTRQEFDSAPPLIRSIYTALIHGVPVPLDKTHEARTAHPEYFLVPDDIFIAYQTELMAATKEILKRFPERDGVIMYTDRLCDYVKRREALAPLLDRVANDLLKKYFPNFSSHDLAQ